MKRRKHKAAEIEMGGQDSFLDLVSNIISILLILVMVAGVRAQFSSANASDPLEPPADSQILADIEAKYEELQTKAEKAVQLRSDLEDTRLQSEIMAEQIRLQSMEYTALFDAMTVARADIEFAAEAKSQTFKEKIEYLRQLQETNAQLEQIDKRREYLRQIRPQATVMENIPTPLSRTVEEKEIHIRLLGGRVVYVPLAELSQQMSRYASEERNRLVKQRSLVGKVGPIENFELEFLLAVYDVPVQGGGIRTGVTYHYAEAVPKFEPLGQPLQPALASPQSEFRRKLSLFRKDIYTVTVWVYPDSFDEYQELKKFLHDLGYSVAARPMAMGDSIGMSPHGTKSATQ